MGAKNEVAAKPETKALPSNPEEDKTEGMKKLATEQKNEMGEKIRKLQKLRLDLHHQTKMRRNLRS